MRRTDEAHVMATWINGFKHKGHAHGVDADTYFRGQRSVVEKLLATAAVAVACDPDDHDVIWGWACASDDVLHWIAVKPPFRRAGVAVELLRALALEKGPLVVSHYTPEVRRRFHCRKIVADPFYLMR
jgi:GNAT superfamily N-acetyltransferase